MDRVLPPVDFSHWERSQHLQVFKSPQAFIPSLSVASQPLFQYYWPTPPFHHAILGLPWMWELHESRATAPGVGNLLHIGSAIGLLGCDLNQTKKTDLPDGAA